MFTDELRSFWNTHPVALRPQTRAAALRLRRSLPRFGGKKMFQVRGLAGFPSALGLGTQCYHYYVVLTTADSGPRLRHRGPRSEHARSRRPLAWVSPSEAVHFSEAFSPMRRDAVPCRCVDVVGSR